MQDANKRTKRAELKKTKREKARKENEQDCRVNGFRGIFRCRQVHSSVRDLVKVHKRYLAAHAERENGHKKEAELD